MTSTTHFVNKQGCSLQWERGELPPDISKSYIYHVLKMVALYMRCVNYPLKSFAQATYCLNKFAQRMYWQNCFIVTDCWGRKSWVHHFNPRGFVSMHRNEKLCVIDLSA